MALLGSYGVLWSYPGPFGFPGGPTGVLWGVVVLIVLPLSCAYVRILPLGLQGSISSPAHEAKTSAACRGPCCCRHGGCSPAAAFARGAPTCTGARTLACTHESVSMQQGADEQAKQQKQTDRETDGGGIRVKGKGRGRVKDKGRGRGRGRRRHTRNRRDKHEDKQREKNRQTETDKQTDQG